MNKIKRNKTTGAVMVEFAIILPLLVLLLFGITEVGRALYQQNMLHRALTVGARYLSHKDGIILHDVANGTCSTVESTEYSYSTEVNIARNLILCGRESCGSDAILPNLTLGNISVTLPETATLYDSTNGLYACVIQISAQAEFAGLFDTVIPFTNMQTPNLNAQTEVRYIGY